MNDDQTPVKVSLRDLARASTPIAQALKPPAVPFHQRPPKTPAGLPQGCAWLPHDTGKLGYAAARRRRQAERLAAKRAGKETTNDDTLLREVPAPDALP